MASRATSSRSGPSGSSSGSSSSSSVSRTRVGKYELGRTLGEGTFAKVKFARNVVNGENVAIKIIDKEKVLRNKMIAQWSRLETEVSMDAARASPCGSPCNGLRSRILQPTCKFRSGQSSNPGAGSPAGAPIPLDQSNLFKREISTMKLIKHPNVIRMLEVMASKTKIYFVLEFVTGGELFDKSPENLLLDANGTLNVSDFGLSALPQQVQEDSLLHSTCGTPNYVAPQVINNKGYDGAKADLWSCGVILFVLMAGYLPFEDSNLASLYKKIFKAEFTCPHWFSAKARASTGLSRSEVIFYNGQRITFAEVIENEWFNKGYKAPKYENANVSLDDVDAIFDESGESQKLVVERREEGLRTPVTRNAFELISTSKGLNLGSLFEKQMGLVKMKIQFTSKCPANEIVTKIEAAAEPMGFDVKKNNYKLVGEKSGRKGQLAVTTEVFQVAPSLYMVEIRKSGGDTLEFHKFYKNLTTGLKDIVWKTIDEVKEEGTQVSGGAVVAS